MIEQKIELERHTLEFMQTIECLEDPAAVAVAFQIFVANLGMRTACCMKVPEQGEDVSEHVLMNTNPPGFQTPR